MNGEKISLKELFKKRRVDQNPDMTYRNKFVADTLRYGGFTTCGKPVKPQKDFSRNFTAIDGMGISAFDMKENQRVENFREYLKDFPIPDSKIEAKEFARGLCESAERVFAQRIMSGKEATRMKYLHLEYLSAYDKLLKNAFERMIPFGEIDVYRLLFEKRKKLIREINEHFGIPPNSHISERWGRFFALRNQKYNLNDEFMLEVMEHKLSVAKEINAELHEIARLSTMELKSRLLSEEAKEKMKDADLMSNIKAVASIMTAERNITMREKTTDALVSSMQINPFFLEVGAVEVRDAEVVEEAVKQVPEAVKTNEETEEERDSN